MHIGGGAALEAVRSRVARAMRSPVIGIAAITPIVFAGAVAATPGTVSPIRDSAVTPLAAVAPSPINPDGASVVAATKAPTPFHIASGAGISGPPPSVVVSSPGTLRIPMIALNAYQNAERMMAASYPGCGISWNLLAGIGRIESMHANGGATDVSGSAARPIYGPSLDGSLPGNEVIELSRNSSRVTYARALGPMQFLPGTWSRYASDGNGDGKADVQNVFDASLAAARYLCSGGLNLRDQSQVMTAILRYNNSMAYAQKRAWLGGRLRDGRRTARPAADHRPDSADRRRAPRQLPGPWPRLADERSRAARRRPTGDGALVEPDPHRRRGPAQRPVRPVARPCAGGCAGDGAARSGPDRAVLDAAVDAGDAATPQPAAAADAELRGVLHRQQPTGARAAPAAARGAAPRCRARLPHPWTSRLPRCRDRHHRPPARRRPAPGAPGEPLPVVGPAPGPPPA